MTTVIRRKRAVRSINRGLNDLEPWLPGLEKIQHRLLAAVMQNRQEFCDEHAIAILDFFTGSFQSPRVQPRA